MWINPVVLISVGIGIDDDGLDLEEDCSYWSNKFAMVNSNEMTVKLGYLFFQKDCVCLKGTQLQNLKKKIKSRILWY